jgi:alkylation response protein AidB-like acyl-CoA dehydrogenase
MGVGRWCCVGASRPHMDLRLTPEEARFRAELRAFLERVLPTLPSKPPRHDWKARREFDTAWQRMLYEAGFAGLGWPEAYGGRPASAVQRLVLLEELERARAPYVGVNFVGLLHAGPTILAWGTEEQKQRYVPPILSGQEVWCQGFSEPGAGSDLAALSTRAVRHGDHYVVTGQKVWTSHAEVADLCELLVRTGAPEERHRGITWLIMEMDAPGVEIRPLRTLVGSTEFAELFLDGVRVPVANRVGPEGGGWKVAMTTFAFERGSAFLGELLASRELLASLWAILDRRGACEHDERRGQLVELTARFEGLRALALKSVSEVASGTGPGVAASALKLGFSEARQELLELAMGLAGWSSLALQGLDWPDLADDESSPHAHMPRVGELVDAWLAARALTIAAGSSQVQRNILAERALGLPRGRGA